MFATAAPGAIRHRHAVAGRDVGIRRVEINFAAAARGQQRHRRGERLDAARFFVEHISAEAAVLADVTELLARDQINREVVFKNLDVRLRRNRREQARVRFRGPSRPSRAECGAWNGRLPCRGRVPVCHDCAGLRARKISCPVRSIPAMRAGPSSTIVRTTLSLHKPRARFERVAHVQLERILLARHRRDAALRVIRVRLRAVFFVTMATRPRGATFSANESPAMPLPRTR